MARLPVKGRGGETLLWMSGLYLYRSEDLPRCPHGEPDRGWSNIRATTSCARLNLCFALRNMSVTRSSSPTEGDGPASLFASALALVAGA